MVLAIFGSGSLGQEIMSLAIKEKKDYSEIVFIDDVTQSSAVCGCRVYTYQKFCENFSADCAKIVIALGEPIYRKKIYGVIKKNRYQFATIVSGMSFVGSDTQLGEGTIIFPNVYIGNNVKIGENVVIHAGSNIVEGVSIGKDSFISLGSFIGSRTTIKPTCFVGPNAAITDNITVAKNCIVGMGAVVLKETNENSVLAGVPAKILRRNEDGMVFR